MDENFNIRDYLDTNSLSEEQIDNCEFWTTANRMVRNSGKCNFQDQRIPVNSSWDLDKLQQWLQNYHDKQLIEFLKYGWPLNATDTAINDSVPKNSPVRAEVV